MHHAVHLEKNTREHATPAPFAVDRAFLRLRAPCTPGAKRIRFSLMDPRGQSEGVVMKTKTAHEAYRVARERLDERLNMLSRLIRAHDKREFRARENWAYAGILSHAINVLDELIAFWPSSDVLDEHADEEVAP